MSISLLVHQKEILHWKTPYWNVIVIQYYKKHLARRKKIDIWHSQRQYWEVGLWFTVYSMIWEHILWKFIYRDGYLGSSVVLLSEFSTTKYAKLKGKYLKMNHNSQSRMKLWKQFNIFYYCSKSLWFIFASTEVTSIISILLVSCFLFSYSLSCQS